MHGGSRAIGQSRDINSHSILTCTRWPWAPFLTSLGRATKVVFNFVGTMLSAQTILYSTEGSFVGHL